MPVTRALTAYQQLRLNCAQSVLHAFHPHPNITEKDILDAKRLGDRP